MRKAVTSFSREDGISRIVHHELGKQSLVRPLENGTAMLVAPDQGSRQVVAQKN